MYDNRHVTRNITASKEVICPCHVSIFVTEEITFNIPITIIHTPTIAADPEKTWTAILSSFLSINVSCDMLFNLNFLYCIFIFTGLLLTRYRDYQDAFIIFCGHPIAFCISR